MSRILSLCLVAILLGGCGGDSHLSLSQESVEITNELLDIFERVHDEADLARHEVRLQTLTRKAQELARRLEALGPPSPEQAREVAEELGPEVMPMINRLQNLSRRFEGNDRLASHVQQVMASMVQ